MRTIMLAVAGALAMAALGSGPATGQGLLLNFGSNHSSDCSYEVGGTDVAMVQFGGGLGETTSVGGCIFDPYAMTASPQLASVFVADALFAPVGGVLCTDVDGDGVCGDPSKAEASVPFCAAAGDVAIGDPWFAPPWVVAVFVDSAVSNLNHCGVLGQGTTGWIHFEAYPDETPPPPCTWSSKTVHASLETVGAGWSTKVDHQISFLYGCSGGPLVSGLGSFCSAIYHTTTDCGSGVNSAGGTKYGVFTCSATGCASDHTLQSWIWVSNDGSFSCTDYVSVSPPSMNKHCHQH